MLVKRSGRGVRDPERLEAVVGRARARHLAPGDLGEGDELSRVCRGESVEEMRPRRTRLGWNAGLDRAYRCPRPEPDADRILRAVQLRADVVTERIVARDLDDSERTVVHPERRDGRVDVVVLGEHREATHVAIGVDLRNFAPGQPAEDVEVMDREVPEQPTRLRDIGLVWRLGVVADQVEVVERAELAAGEHPARLSVARIEPPLEADLERDPGLADTTHDVDGRGEILGERLLAERREA